MKKYISFLVIIFSISCDRHPQAERANGLCPKVVNTRGHWINPDNVEKPKVVRASPPNIVSAGKPTKTIANFSCCKAKRPEFIKTVQIRMIDLGLDSLKLPQKTIAIGSKRAPVMPEEVQAKDMMSKDHNPQSFGTFSKQQGLKHGSISCLMEDKLGNIWIGTYGGGVSRYDGKSFSHYTEQQGLSSNDVRCILQDKKGDIWFGTNGGGISEYDGVSFTNYSKNNGLPNNIIRCMLEDRDGNLWFGSFGGGVIKYDGRNFIRISKEQGLSDNYIYCMQEDHLGQIWIGTKSGGINMFDGKSISVYCIQEKNIKSQIRSIYEDASGKLWFGTNDAGVFCYDQKEFSCFTTEQGLSNNSVSCIYEDKDNCMWFGTQGGGVSKYDRQYFYKFSEEEGLYNNFIEAILEDRSKNLWFATNGGGVSKYFGKLFNHYTDKDGLGSCFVRDIIRDTSGSIWFGLIGDGGLSKYDGKCFSHYSTKEGLPSNYVPALLADRSGNLWFATSEGVTMFDGVRFYSYGAKEGLIGGPITCMLEDRMGCHWFGSSTSGMTKFDGVTFTNYSERTGLCGDDIRDIVEDKFGNIWFASFCGGLSKFDGKSFTNYTTIDGLESNSILVTTMDKSGNLWFGTSGAGVILYDNATSFTYISERQGLVNNFVMNILEDGDENLWVGTRFGLSRICKANLSALSSNKGKIELKDALFENFTYDDGFLGVGCQERAILQSNGLIWIGGNDRLTICNAPKEMKDSVAPNIQVTGVSVYNETINWLSLANKKDTAFYLGNGVKVRDLYFDGVTKWYMLPENLSLANNNNSLTFNFIGITNNQPKKVKYQYKLEGIDENWSALTNRTEASYGNLPSGDYSFKVKAMNRSGLWSPPVAFQFSIRPPWWKTWWCKGLLTLFILSSVLYYIRWRENRISKIKNSQIKSATDMLEVQVKERERIASDLHDRLGSMLATVKLYFNSVEENFEHLKNENKAHYAKASALLDEACKEVRRISHDLASGVLVKLGLMAALQELKETVSKTGKLYVDVYASGMNERLPVEMEVNIYRIIQELLSNALKHSMAKNLILQITRNENELNLIVEDNGIGLAEGESAAQDGIGLKNVRERTKKMNGRMKVDSRAGRGITFIFDIPIQIT